MNLGGFPAAMLAEVAPTTTYGEAVGAALDAAFGRDLPALLGEDLQDAWEAGEAWAEGAGGELAAIGFGSAMGYMGGAACIAVLAPTGPGALACLAFGTASGTAGTWLIREGNAA